MAKDAFKNPAREDSSDRKTFKLDYAQTAAFLEALANPPAPTKALYGLMSRPSPWDVGKA